MIFTCTSCYATWFSLALSWSSLALHATLLDFHLHFHDLHLHFMLLYLIFTCTFMIFTCTSCNAKIPTHGKISKQSLECSHRHDWQLLEANENSYSKVSQLSVKTDTFAYPQLAMEIHTCWAWWLVSIVWQSSGQVVGKTSQRVKNTRRCGNRHIGSQRCIRGGNGILTKFACRWGKKHKKKQKHKQDYTFCIIVRGKIIGKS